jgi:hypothetical protein
VGFHPGGGQTRKNKCNYILNCTLRKDMRSQKKKRWKGKEERERDRERETECESDRD